jgi:hypothetical protein
MMVVEFKPLLTVEAVGQALVYRELVRDEEREGWPVDALIVCWRGRAEIERVAGRYDVQVEVMAPDVVESARLAAR